jgi:hypothetical protein
MRCMRDDVPYKEIKLVLKIATNDNFSDAMTKNLGRVKFQQFRERMGVVECQLHGRKL